MCKETKARTWKFQGIRSDSVLTEHRAFEGFSGAEVVGTHTGKKDVWEELSI